MPKIGLAVIYANILTHLRRIESSDLIGVCRIANTNTGLKAFDKPKQ